MVNNEPRFKIGDTVFQARAGQKQIWITCPECLGSGRLCVTLGDGSQVSIACECCSRGYEGSPGRISTYRFLAETQTAIITGVESDLRDGVLRTRYKFDVCYSTEEPNLFLTRDEAQIRAEEIMREHEAEEIKRIGYKKNQSKTWAWHVAYYRRQIRSAQEDIARATAKLSVIPKKGAVPSQGPIEANTGRAETGGKGKYGE